MNSLKKFMTFVVGACLFVSFFTSCSASDGNPPVLPSETPQTIPYSQSTIEAFAEKYKNSKEVYIECFLYNTFEKVAIDVRSENSYVEVLNNGKIEKTYFLHQSKYAEPEGVYSLFEAENENRYYPIEGDATIDIAETLMDMSGIGKYRIESVEVNYNGTTRIETAKFGEETATFVFDGNSNIPVSISEKNDMQDFTIEIRLFLDEVTDTHMKESLDNELKGRTLYIPTAD